MAFQYDFGKSTTHSSWLDLLGHVDKLLHGLALRRENVGTRPLLFALLIAKEQEYFHNILKLTGGIVFLGCLNDENHPDFEEVCLKCAAVEFGTSQKHDAVGSLKKSDSWDMVKEVLESFRSMRCPFPVRILYELKHTHVYEGLVWKIIKGKSQNLCSERISTLGWNDERLIGVDKDHAELIKYPHRGDAEGFFNTFMETLSELVDIVSPEATEICRMELQQTDTNNGGWSLLSAFGSTSNLMLDPSVAPGPTQLRTRSMSQDIIEIPKVSCFVLQPYEENQSFVGREDILSEIHNQLQTSTITKPGQKSFVLTGLGGMGKTQIAIKYAYRYRQLYPVTLLAHSDGQAKLSESFALFARELGLGDALNPIQAKQAVKDFLKTLRSPWLMIFDNADGDDNVQLLTEFWPEADTGSILITSRNHTLRNKYPGLYLIELDENSAIHLLFSLTSLSRAAEDSVQAEKGAAAQIVQKIGYLPLGISQAASMILNDSCSMAEFLEAYNLQELINDCEDVRLVSGDTTYKYSLRTVWNMNYDRLTHDQQQLIKLMSFLDPDRIQSDFLRVGASTIGDSSLDFIGNAYKFNKCKSGLIQSTLVTQSQTRKELRMHRLVSASCQLRMDFKERQQFYQKAIKLIRAVWPVPPRIAVHNPSLWGEQRALLPHVQRLREVYDDYRRNGQSLVPEEPVNWEFASMLYEAGWFCYESGLLESVFDLLHSAKEYCLRHIECGGGFRILADVYGGLGSLDTESNQFQSAFDNFQNHEKYVQLAINSGELKRPCIWEVFALGRLANGFQGLHRYSEAESFYRKCLTAWEALPGDRKIFTTHLSTCLWLQGRVEEAEQVIRSIIKDQNDISNFRTAMAMYALGNITISRANELTSSGMKVEADSKFAEAMELHCKVQYLWTKTLGARHHKTADAIYKVGWHLHRINEYDKALVVLGKALDIYAEQPKLFKNEIARTKYKMGCVHQDAGKFDEGSKLIREAERSRQDIVPPECWELAEGENAFDEIVQFWTR
ncbi:hypothetical protein F5B20DRAFT_591667 [Whalleya microplaca]|nr:hypothetical protein F5B20DRAFT_591667 [Whalleya microplaca]